MTEPDDIDALAAEYVLGTLDFAERATIAARRQREPALNEAILAWEQRLGPLAETVSSEAPPLHLYDAIVKRISGALAVETLTPPVTEIIDLKRRLRWWRSAAIATGAIAASLVVAVGLREALRTSPPKTFVAVLQKDAASPAFLVSVDLETRLLTVRPVAAQPQPGKSYELWIVNAKLGSPRSLGVIQDKDFTVRPTPATFDRETVETSTYAVTLEPAGGSPTGAPTGPVLFTGQLVQATP